METTTIEPQQATTPSQEVQLFSVTIEGIQQFADKYKALKADDKVGFKAVETAHKEIKKKRQAITSRIKELVEPHQQEISKIKHVGNTILNILAPAEEHLEKERKDYEAEQERLKQLEIQRKEELRQNRINLLRDNGCTFTGDVYAIGNEVIQAASLAEIPEDIFSLVLGRVKAEKVRIEEEKKRLELEAKLAEERHNELLKYNLSVPRNQLGNMPADEYNALLLSAEKEHNDRIAKSLEEQRRNQLRIDRTLELATYGGSSPTTDLADIPDDEYAALIAEVKAEYEAFIAEKKKLKEEAEAREKANADAKLAEEAQKLSEQAVINVELTKEELQEAIILMDPADISQALSSPSIPVHFEPELLEEHCTTCMPILHADDLRLSGAPKYDGSDLLSEQATKIIKEIVPVRMQQAIELLRKVMRDRGASAAIKNEIMLFLNSGSNEG